MLSLDIEVEQTGDETVKLISVTHKGAETDG
jgi:hypothetical protein